MFWHTGPVTGQGIHTLSGHLSSLTNFKGFHYSEQQVIDCASSSVCDCSYGCHTWTLMDYFLENGLTTDASYMRYNASVGTCMKDVPGGILESHRTDWDLTDAEIVMHLQNGPVVGVVCIDDEFRFYRGGILGEINRPYCQTPNHAIAIVGYGTDEYGVDYWIGKNSHWTTWGEGGYFRVKKVGGRNTKRDHVFGAYVTIPELAAYPTVANVNRYDYTLGSHDCTDYATWCWVLPCAPECGVITAPTGDNVNCTEKEGALSWCQKTCQNVWPNGNGICPLQYPPKYVKDMIK